MNQVPVWKKEMYKAERDRILRLLVVYFDDYLTENGLAETEYKPGDEISETDKLFTLAKMYFRLTEMKEMTFDRIAHQSCIITLRSIMEEMIDKHFREETK